MNFHFILPLLKIGGHIITDFINPKKGKMMDKLKGVIWGYGAPREKPAVTT
jgi:hypothetical protein